MDPLVGPLLGWTLLFLCAFLDVWASPMLTLYFTKQGSCVAFLSRNCMWREGGRMHYNQIKVEGEEMRLQLIMGLAADVLHESNSLQPVCFHGNRISNYWALALPPPSFPPRWRLMNVNYLQLLLVPLLSLSFLSPLQEKAERHWEWLRKGAICVLTKIVRN